MDIGRALSFVFEDEDWIKVILIGGLLMLIPLFGQIVLIGLLLETARNVAMGSPRPLPKWDNIGEKFKLGFYGFVIQLVYSLPLLILTCLFACVIAAAGGSAGANEEAAAGGIAVATFCFVPLVIVLAFVLQPFMFAGMIRYLQTGDLSAALRVGDIVGMVRRDLSTYVMLVLVFIAGSFLASLGSVVLVIGALFTTVYAQIACGHVLGQVLAKSTNTTNLAGYQ